MSRLAFNRRQLLAAGAAGFGAMALPRIAGAQDFPSRNIDITIPTGEGGAADTATRAFCSVWRNHIDANFEFGFYAGASGQVGYEHYMRRVEPDPHHLLSSFIGPEVIMLTLQDTGIRPGEDIVYFQEFASEAMVLFVGAESPFQTLEQFVEEGRRRTLSVSKSRLPHPASICALSMGEATGASINLVPFGGGNPAAMAAVTGEVDACALGIGVPIQLGDQVRVLGVFADTNPVSAETGDAPTVNDALGLDLPILDSTRAWAIQRRTIEQFPEEFEILKSTMRATVEDPAFVEAMGGAGVPPEFVATGGEESAMASAQATAELAERYRDLLTGA